MCGVFGILTKENSKLKDIEAKKLIVELYKLSEARGKESSGIAIKNYDLNKIEVFKSALPATNFIKCSEFSQIIESHIGDKNESLSGRSIIAHARMVTNGDSSKNYNNQPVVKQGRVLVHNGIVTNVDAIWDEIGGREFDVDSEVVVELLNKNSLSEGLRRIDRDLKGSFSCATFSTKFDSTILFTNTGSLYWFFDEAKKVLVFASENYILETALNEVLGTGDRNIKLLEPGTILSFAHLSEDSVSLFDLDNFSGVTSETSEFLIEDLSPLDTGKKDEHFKVQKELIQFPFEDVRSLKRCSKCILPETFPYISFDNQGVCNYCHGYKSKMPTINTGEKLREVVLSKKKSGQRYDCIIPFSGGRDSSYGLHYVVKELGLKPLTYTYDWGMVTDLARRNIARMTGELGVENILVSADIAKKRENIRKNVSAWLKKPQLGMIPLFMAGDKQFFYYVNKIKRQNDISVDVWAHNSLEDTHFKAGFAGVVPQLDKERVDFLAKKNQIKMAWYYGTSFLKNPAYINSSLLDTAWAFYSYYAEPRTDFYIIFDFLPWRESEVENVLLKQYDWELAKDTQSSWRIGDGTAAFYNYIYYTVCGFSEVDTMLSNQIREGLITREAALQRAERDNAPRIESLEWYLKTINVDFQDAVKTINSIDRLYSV